MRAQIAICCRFQSHFNTFIGGRGSGKSTVLESIRIAARQDKSLEEDAPETLRVLTNSVRSLPINTVE